MTTTNPLSDDAIAELRAYASGEPMPDDPDTVLRRRATTVAVIDRLARMQRVAYAAYDLLRRDGCVDGYDPDCAYCALDRALEEAWAAGGER